MKTTLTNIKASSILAALRMAKPVTANGRAAVENYRTFLVSNPMTAIALENSIISLTTTHRDAGLENLVTVLKGLMPEAKRRVAVAYEMLATAPKTFFSVQEAAMEALSGLYDLHAAEIIDSINSGALDAYKTNPTILKLIQWAKNAAKSAPEKVASFGGEVTMTLTPILNVATAPGGELLIAIDGRCYLQGKRGKLTYIPDIRSMESIPSDVMALVKLLGMMHASDTEPNMLLVNNDVLEQIHKALPVKKFGIDLMAGADALVVIDGEAMSVDKAKAMMQQGESSIVASMMLDETVRNAVELVGNIMNMFERFRGSIYTNRYANKFVFGGNIAYIVKEDSTATLISVINGSVTGSTVYDSIYDVLGSDICVGNAALTEAISQAFSNDLKADAQKLSVRQKLAQKLTEERQQYESLLERIKAEEDELATVSDVNQDKVKQLSELKKKTEDAIASVNDEISKLSKA